MDEVHSGGGDFNMRSAREDHMSKEDLGPEASNQDWTDLPTLREDVRYWEELISHQFYPIRWSQVPLRSKEISCFYASTKVRMYTTIKGGPQYKRMDKLVKGDKLWTRRYRRIEHMRKGHLRHGHQQLVYLLQRDHKPTTHKWMYYPHTSIEILFEILLKD